MKNIVDALNMDERDICTRLHAIYKKHQAKYKHNPDSKQMCCMWSTRNPPDLLCDTKPIRDIEKAFDIELDEDDAIELYDLTVEEASKWIADLRPPLP